MKIVDFIKAAKKEFNIDIQPSYLSMINQNNIFENDLDFDFKNGSKSDFFNFMDSIDKKMKKRTIYVERAIVDDVLNGNNIGIPEKQFKQLLLKLIQKDRKINSIKINDLSLGIGGSIKIYATALENITENSDFLRFDIVTSLVRMAIKDIFYDFFKNNVEIDGGMTDDKIYPRNPKYGEKFELFIKHDMKLTFK